MFLNKVKLILPWIAAAAFAFLPIHTANAQDLELVERRLGGMVESGMINLEQAQIMLGALRDSMHHEEHHHEGPEHHATDDLHGMFERVAAVLAENEIQPELAGPVFEVIEKLAAQIREQGNQFELGDEFNEYLRSRLELNSDQVRLVVRIAERLADANTADRENERDALLHRVESQLRTAVEMGDLSPVDAEVKLNELREKLFRDRESGENERNDDERERQLANAVARVHAAVAQGDMSAEEAERTLQRLKNYQRNRRFRAAAEELQNAVQQGRLSREEAEVQLSKLKREFIGGETNPPKDRPNARDRRRGNQARERERGNGDGMNLIL